MTAPLVFTFEVRCPVQHAFSVWTSGIASWWPKDHSVTHRPDLRVVLESGVGGRIFERTADGEEHDWGEVTVWEPPDRLAYLWHLGRNREFATEVEIHFLAKDSTFTTVQIQHTGWERLGDTAGIWRERNTIGWQTLLPHFRSAVEGDSS